MGCLFLISDFTIGFSKEEFPLPILVGNHRDFDVGWFKDIGIKMVMAVLSNSIAPHFAKGFEPFIQKTLRYILDRCCKKHLRKKTNVEEEKAKAEAKQ